MVIATTSGSAVAENTPRLSSIPNVEHAAIEDQRGHATHDQEQAEEERQLEQAQRFLRESSMRSNLMPLTTKKKGMKKP